MEDYLKVDYTSSIQIGTCNVCDENNIPVYIQDNMDWGTCESCLMEAFSNFSKMNKKGE